MTWFQLTLLTGATWAFVLSIPAVDRWRERRVEVRRVVRVAERITRAAAEEMLRHRAEAAQDEQELP